MPAHPKICVVIPVFNHELTVGRVVRGAGEYFPVMVVNDGSTDATGGILAAESCLTVVTLPQNQGKGAALRAGFAEAERRGFTHAVTLDADGQHAPGEVPLLAAATRCQPDALIVGVRDLAKENAPRARRISNQLSNFWFTFQTGIPLPDTQCGFRSYPLRPVNRMRVRSQRYAFELEVLVRAAWSGMPVTAQPVSADYASPTSRLSHFHPCRDLVRISLLHLRLSLQTLWLAGRHNLPAPAVCPAD
jgi:glycosyltransferase involved in cell wall biosynthesis